MSVLVGRKAPHFSAGAVINGEEIVENFSLSEYAKDSYSIFFFYPKDFTFVCPTELHAFQAKLAEFESKGCKIVRCLFADFSSDSRLKVSLFLLMKFCKFVLILSKSN